RVAHRQTHDLAAPTARSVGADGHLQGRVPESRHRRRVPEVDSGDEGHPLLQRQLPEELLRAIAHQGTLTGHPDSVPADPARRQRGRALTTIWYERDADPSALDGARVAVVGYGNQGRSWALNLRDSGLDIGGCVRA